MTDSQFSPLGTVAAPAAWKIPPSLQLELKTAYAHFDGSGAAGSFIPCLRVKSDSGHVAFQSTATTTVAAGASADVSWFRDIAVASSGGGSAGSYPLTITAVKSADYTANAGEFVPCDITTGDVQLTLPTAPADTTIVAAQVYARSFTATHAITFKCGGADTFAGSGGTTVRLAQSIPSTHQGQTMFVQYQASAAQWFVTDNNLPVGLNDNALVTLTPDQAGGGCIAIDLRNSTDWTQGPLRLPNNRSLAGHNAAGNAIYDIAKLDTANPPNLILGDALLAGLQSVQPICTVTGSRGGNAALASLLSGLAAAGFIVNNSTA